MMQYIILCHTCTALWSVQCMACMVHMVHDSISEPCMVHMVHDSISEPCMTAEGLQTYALCIYRACILWFTS